MPEQPEKTTQPHDLNPDPPTPQPTPDGNSSQDFWGQDYSRREFLKKAVAAGATLVGSAGVVVAAKVIADTISPPLTLKNEPSNPRPGNSVVPPPSASELPKSPEILTPGIEFGFNTHLDNEAQNMNLDLFKKCVEDLSAKGQNWIRFNFKGSFASDPQIVSDFDQGLDFAKQKGLKVALVTDPPDLSNSQAVSDYYKGIAEKFKGKVDIWQIFNEPNAHDFKDYSPRPKVTDEYLKGFSEAVAAASAAIKQVDTGAKTTINLSDWIGDHRDIEAEGDAFFGSVAGSIDIVTLDLYPDNPNSDPGKVEVAKYPGYISHFKNTFGKDVMIGEIGWPTYENGFTAQDQATYMQQVMSVLSGGSAKPTAVLFYEWADEAGIGENAFGANNADGAPKDPASYDQLIHSMTPPKSGNDLRTPQVI